MIKIRVLRLNSASNFVCHIQHDNTPGSSKRERLENSSKVLITFLGSDGFLFFIMISTFSGGVEIENWLKMG